MTNKQKQLVFFGLPLVVFLGLLLMLGLRLGKPTDIVTSSALDKPLPSFSLPLLNDTNRIITNADLPKEPYILNVWGSWCPTCRVEHPFLVKLHSEGVPMVGANYKDELPAALGYLKEFKDPFLYSFQDYDGRFALDLGLMGAPESFVVDTEGVVRLHIVGELHEENYAKQVKPCMAALADASLSKAEQDAQCKGV
ncbi:MAG: DsbE family thiol:disulfide interchange protein [Moraxella sp.]|nr:DsbE family thiol:disulfide interchange protein [Moraxella sp.]